MVVLLILGGLLMIAAGLFGLVVQAFGTSLFWGMGSLVPPITFVYAFGHWYVARKAVILAAMGLIPLVVGMAMLAAQSPIGLETVFAAGERDTEKLDIQLSGKLNGQDFAPQHAELVDGVLRLHEGSDFFIRRELSIHLGTQPKGAFSLDVLPLDDGPKPEIEISWLLPEQELPVERSIPNGYTLHLNLVPVAPNRFVGEFHLVLPPRFSTAVSGHLEVATDLQGDGVQDSLYGVRGDLTYVIRDYLQRRFVTRDVELLPLPAFSLTAQALEIEAQARVDGQLQRLSLPLLKQEGGWRVGNDGFPPLAPSAVSVAWEDIRQQAPESGKPAHPKDRRQCFSLSSLLNDPAHYQGLDMRVDTVKGRTAEGRFVGLDSEGRLLVRLDSKGAGAATFSLELDEIAQAELLAP